MLVRCIKDDYSESKSEVVKAILKVGDLDCLPKMGNFYEVVGHFFDNTGDEEIQAYMLEGEGLKSTEAYGVRLCFRKEFFQIVDQTFIPNSMDEDGNLVLKMPYHMNIKFDTNGEDFTEMTFVHNGNKKDE